MDHYLFFFGRTPGLSMAELSAFVPSAGLFDTEIGLVGCSTAMIDGDVHPIESLISYLGGTIKISKIVSEGRDITDAELIGHITPEPGGECVFALSSHTPRWRPDQAVLRRVKEALSRVYPHVRYLEARHESGVSNVAIRKEHAIELTVLEKDGKFVVAKTVAVQNVDDWTKREFGRPYADAKAGMLPVKVARMAVNIGLGHDGKGKTVFDPFCGMGTILSEALERTSKGMGGDIDEDVVRKANENLRWAVQTFGYPADSYSIEKADAVHSSDRIGEKTVDAIVTEPFLGTTKLGEGKITDPTEIKNIVKGLTKLYKGCLKDWKSVLKENGRIVIAFPSIMRHSTVYSPVKSIIDSCEILGYTKLLGPLSYHRPDAIVRREFFVFEKK